MKYYCSGCKKIILSDRKKTGKSYISYCEIVDKVVNVKPVKPRSRITQGDIDD